MNNWSEVERPDLNVIPLLEEKGFEPIFSYKDRYQGRTTPDNCPLDDIFFVNNVGDVINLHYKLVPTDEYFGNSRINKIVPFWVLISNGIAKEIDTTNQLLELI